MTPDHRIRMRENQITESDIGRVHSHSFPPPDIQVIRKLPIELNRTLLDYQQVGHTDYQTPPRYSG